MFQTPANWSGFDFWRRSDRSSSLLLDVDSEIPPIACSDERDEEMNAMFLRCIPIPALKAFATAVVMPRSSKSCRSIFDNTFFTIIFPSTTWNDSMMNAL
jgi:hypothetical protein